MHESALIFVHPTGAVTAGDEVTLYPVIADPPSDVGALHVRITWVSPGVVITFVGAPGTVRGVMAEDGEDAGDSPAIFIAATVKVYAVPLVSPVKVQVSALMLVQSAGAATVGEEVTV